MIEKGLCQCGCGQRTRIATASNTKRGWTKGKPVRFINGHNSAVRKGFLNPSWKGGQTISTEGYQLIKNPGHPRAYRNGYIPKHILLAEQVLKKPLPPKAVVHHFPDKKTFTHLIVCENDVYHHLLHLRHQALKVSGHPNWRKCAYCHKHDSPENLHIGNPGEIVYHTSCKSAYYRNRSKSNSQ